MLLKKRPKTQETWGPVYRPVSFRPIPQDVGIPVLQKVVVASSESGLIIAVDQANRFFLLYMAPA